MSETRSPLELACIKAAETGADVIEFTQPDDDIGGLEEHRVIDVPLNKPKKHYPQTSGEITFLKDTEEYLGQNRNEIERCLEIDLDEEREVEDYETDIIDLAVKIELAASNLKKTIEAREGESETPDYPDLQNLYVQYDTLVNMVQHLNSLKVMNGLGYNEEMFSQLKRIVSQMASGFDIIGDFVDRKELEEQIRRIEEEKDKIAAECGIENIQDRDHRWEIGRIIKINTEEEDPELIKNRIKKVSIGILSNQKNLAAQIGNITAEVNSSPNGKRISATDCRYVIERIPTHKQLEHLLRSVLLINRVGITSALSMTQIAGIAANERVNMTTSAIAL